MPGRIFALVALATSGLSCLDKGVSSLSFTLPPRLVCSDVAFGQSLGASVARAADTLKVTVRAAGVSTEGWQLVSVSDLVGAIMLGLTGPRAKTKQPLEFSLRPLTSTTSHVSFSVAATLFGFYQDSCAVSRTFHVEIAPGSVQIGGAGPDGRVHVGERGLLALASREGSAPKPEGD